MWQILVIQFELFEVNDVIIAIFLIHEDLRMLLLLSIHRQDIAFGYGLGSRMFLDVIAGKSVVIKILCCVTTVQGTVTVDDVIQLLQQVIKGSSVAVALTALAVMAAVAVELERVLLLLHLLLLTGFVVVVRPCVGEAHEQRIGQGTVHRSREIRHS